MGFKNVSMEEIPVKTIIYNSLNLRGLFRSPDQIRRTARSIQEVGLLHHPVVSMTTGGPLVVAGESRVLSYSYLAREGSKEYGKILCKVLEGISEELAMKILAEENFAHGTTVPAATANEIYWHYRVDHKVKDHHSAMNKIKNSWSGSGPYAYNFFIVPGWLIYHSPTIQNLMRMVGPKREGLESSEIQQKIQLIRQVRLNWWHIIADALSPIDHAELLLAPSSGDSEKFDSLMSLVFEILSDRALRGVKALEFLQKECESTKRNRLELIANDSGESNLRRIRAQERIVHIDKIKSRKG